MSTRNRLVRLALSLSLAIPATGLAQNRRSAATRPADDDVQDDAPRSSRARDRGRARHDEAAAAPTARTARVARATPAPAPPTRRAGRGRAQAAEPQARAAEPRARAEETRPRSDERRARAAEREEREAEEQDGDEREVAPSNTIRGLATEGPRVASFVPRGWVLEQQAEGDLTGDRRPDLAILIRQQRPDDAEHDRALVVVERGADGVYARIGVGTRFLLCSSCYGSVAGAVGTPLLSIRRRVLHVDQLSGNREARERALSFSLDAETGHLQLVGEALHTWDRVDHRGTRTASNYLTGARTVERYSGDARRGRETRTVETRRAAELSERVSLEECE